MKIKKQKERSWSIECFSICVCMWGGVGITKWKLPIIPPKKRGFTGSSSSTHLETYLQRGFSGGIWSASGCFVGENAVFFLRQIHPDHKTKRRGHWFWKFADMSNVFFWEKDTSDQKKHVKRHFCLAQKKKVKKPMPPPPPTPLR